MAASKHRSSSCQSWPGNETSNIIVGFEASAAKLQCKYFEVFQLRMKSQDDQSF